MSTDDSQTQVKQLSVPLDVRAACRAGEEWGGEVPVAALPRCRDMAPEAGRLAYRLRFFEGQGVHPLAAELSIEASLALDCARCRETVVQSVSSRSRLSFVFSEEQAEHVETDAEAVILGREGRIKLLELIEDELLMAVPLMPVHDRPCGVISSDRPYESGKIAEPVDEGEDNPFAALAALKKGSGGKD
ncbi:MAG: YceD family protein [Guyparkeria sp.]|uniref:YceD family protein n=1 Tax=Guyparkeria sp. TaxID=2035736 RepID=UPI0039781922